MHFKSLLLYSTLHKGVVYQFFDTGPCGAAMSTRLSILLPDSPLTRVTYDLHVDLYHPEQTLHTNGHQLRDLNPLLCVMALKHTTC